MCGCVEHLTSPLCSASSNSCTAWSGAFSKALMMTLSTVVWLPSCMQVMLSSPPALILPFEAMQRAFEGQAGDASEQSKVGVEACAYCGAAEKGLGHLQQVGAALRHAHDDVRQCSALRYPGKAPASRSQLLKGHHAL